MKKWNARYFVLYAKSNEVRYYADVVPSAWGPVPLGEIGSISLRLIQCIGRPSHPKYKGCRFDITCRNSWGTHYADDFVSSDDEPAETAEKTSTPRASRVYSLMADSPQTAATWVAMLDSLLVRSANSPRPDVVSGSASSATGSGGAAVSSGGTAGAGGLAMLKRIPSAEMLTRRRSSTLDTENHVVLGAGDNVPKAVVYAINYIFDSTPGIETEKFYETEPDAARLKVCMVLLSFLNPKGDALMMMMPHLVCVCVCATVGAQVSQPVFRDRADPQADQRRVGWQSGRCDGGCRRQTVAAATGGAGRAVRDVRRLPRARAGRQGRAVRTAS